MTAFEAIEELHARCAVFTAPETASRLLDGIGWTELADLTSATLLEPCAGEGATSIRPLAARVPASPASPASRVRVDKRGVMDCPSYRS